MNTASKLPRLTLASLPTPLVPALRLQEAVGGPLVWIKRDDLTGFATAGNKARSLEVLLGDALAQGCDSLVTGGGASSNFCAAAAAAAHVAHLACHLVLYGSPPRGGEPAHPNLVAARAAGARIHFTGRPNRDEIDRAVPELAASLTAAGGRPYSLPRGGATALGAIGYAEAFVELVGQLDERGIEPGAIVLATGSGGTQAGLVAAAATETVGRRWRIVGATVSRPPSAIQATIDDLAGQCRSLLGAGLRGAGLADASRNGAGLANASLRGARRNGASLSGASLRGAGRNGASLAASLRGARRSAGLADAGHGHAGACEVVDARGPGFGVVSEEGERARRIAFDTEGLLLDPVYTAKAFAVVLRFLAGGFGQPIVFWHTGGVLAALHHLASDGSLPCPTHA